MQLMGSMVEAVVAKLALRALVSPTRFAFAVMCIALAGCGGGSGNGGNVRPAPEPPPPPPEQCPAGQVGTPPNCEAPPPEQCPAGQVGTPPNCEAPPPEQCPAGQIGTPPNCEEPPPPPQCPAGQIGTPPNCEEPPPPPPMGLNDQHRFDVGFDKVAPNGVWPGNHMALVKPKFAVLEVTTDRAHGRAVQAGACVGYAPGGCTVEADPEFGAAPYTVSNAPFTYIEPRDPNHQHGTFTRDEFRARLREHPELVLASLSVIPAPGNKIFEPRILDEEGIVVVQGAGNESVENWREWHYVYWSYDDVPLQPGEDPPAQGGYRFPEEGALLLRQIDNNQLLLTAGYAKDENEQFVPHPLTTQCGGLEDGCLYGPFEFEVSEYVLQGTSLTAPFIAAGLASVLAVFPETSGEDLIRLAKACAVSEPGLPNGLGRFSLACMDNSEEFHLPKGTTVSEESTASVQARATSFAHAFVATPLPGESTFTFTVEGVPLVREMGGHFDHRVGFLPAETVTEEKKASFSLFFDRAHQVPGVRYGSDAYFVAASLAQEVPHFMGNAGYTTSGVQVAAGTNSAFLRYQSQEGHHDGGGVVSNVAGTGLGATLRHTFATPIGAVQPFLHLDRFMGGEAETAQGSLVLRKSDWNSELGLSLDASLREQEKVSVKVSATRGSGTDDQSVQVRYRRSF